MVYNGYYKVMSNIPKMGQLPNPVKSDTWKPHLDVREQPCCNPIISRIYPRIPLDNAGKPRYRWFMMVPVTSYQLGCAPKLEMVLENVDSWQCIPRGNKTLAHAKGRNAAFPCGPV